MKKILFVAALGMAALYADPASIIKSKCAACHGQKMEKVALGKSAMVNTMSAEQIQEALKGYKAGTLNKYGLGATMRGQAAALSDADIADLAKYITQLK